MLPPLAHYRSSTPSGTVQSMSASTLQFKSFCTSGVFQPHYPVTSLKDVFDNINTDRVDADVRLGPEVGSGMVAVRIAPDMKIVIVGTSEYLWHYGFSQMPSDLVAHPCIA